MFSDEKHPSPLLAAPSYSLSVLGSAPSVDSFAHLPPSYSPSFLPSSSPSSITNLDLAAVPLPTFSPPQYSTSAGGDEVRLLADVLDDSHPAAAYFNTILSRPGAADTIAPVVADRSANRARIKVSITQGGTTKQVVTERSTDARLDVKREGCIEGFIEIGGVDHVVGVDVMIIGNVKAAYMHRGYLTPAECLPVVYHSVKLAPSPLAPNRTVVAPHSVVPFSVVMPTCRVDSTDSELPPTCEVWQGKDKLSIEYFLRIGLTRRGWRSNETLNIPIKYRPNPHISPQRLRALLSGTDSMYPGWKSIPLFPPKRETSTSPSEAAVKGTLLLPSPAIWFIADPTSPPPLPFRVRLAPVTSSDTPSTFDVDKCKVNAKLMRATMLQIAGEKKYERTAVPVRLDTSTPSRTLPTSPSGQVSRDGIWTVSSTIESEEERETEITEDYCISASVNLESGAELRDTLLGSFTSKEIIVSYALEVEVTTGEGLKLDAQGIVHIVWNR